MEQALEENTNLKLFLILLGSKAPNRNVEQHDYFFGIATALPQLIEEIKAFWPEAGEGIHVDGWREVTQVDGFEIKVVLNTPAKYQSDNTLFFINLGGYQQGKLEEQHYTVLTVQKHPTAAIDHAKKTIFYKINTLKSVKGASSHIDEKYGVDVDEIYRVEDILTEGQKKKYRIEIIPAERVKHDLIHLGYLKLNKLAKMI